MSSATPEMRPWRTALVVLGALAAALLVGRYDGTRDRCRLLRLRPWAARCSRRRQIGSNEEYDRALDFHRQALNVEEGTPGDQVGIQATLDNIAVLYNDRR